MTHNVTFPALKNLDTPADIVTALGGPRVVGVFVGRSRSAVSNAVARGVLPADWFDVIEEVAAQRGHSVSRGAFNFRPRPAAVPELAAGTAEPSQEGEAKAPPCASTECAA